MFYTRRLQFTVLSATRYIISEPDDAFRVHWFWTVIFPFPSWVSVKLQSPCAFVLYQTPTSPTVCALLHLSPPSTPTLIVVFRGLCEHRRDASGCVTTLKSCILVIVILPARVALFYTSVARPLPIPLRIWLFRWLFFSFVPLKLL
ncbi:hypothetical protein TRVL_01784 [Trypanosoma vivax]|uniref:Uncharacterized protein n=1 Tax=Trypanosoma vivax (strain Y486) TaxID=1055687 RepID=G0U7Z0_TRYVY|nr:hypothetical protein TRVL_01784 [Trypanosoma vivax]CCC51998.1 hypothetical protein TVY486_1010410 [Trypanosoma vivax Y486]